MYVYMYTVCVLKCFTWIATWHGPHELWTQDLWPRDPGPGWLATFLGPRWLATLAWPGCLYLWLSIDFEPSPALSPLYDVQMFRCSNTLVQITMFRCSNTMFRCSDVQIRCSEYHQNVWPPYTKITRCSDFWVFNHIWWLSLLGTDILRQSYIHLFKIYCMFLEISWK